MEGTMDQSLTIRINGKTLQVRAGVTILEAAGEEGIPIPTLCHSPLLRPLENCRLCVVQVAGERQYKPACSTVVKEGMDITTESEELRQTRKLLLELLLDTHYGDCVAPCTLACPANVDIQGYLALIRHGEYREAVRLVKEKIPMPAVIGRVCPHPCEDACRRHLVDEPVSINPCKRFIADFEMRSGERILPDPPPLTGRSVAIVGGGPAGLSAAYYLRSLGHGATIFEAKPKLGGMLRYGIPEYRLPAAVLDWEIEGVLSLGIEVKTGVQWGRDFTLDDLRREGFDAIYLAIGAWAARKLGIIGEDACGVVRGIDFLEAVSAGSGEFPVGGKRVVVIGGGNVAIDAARSALRLGAREVVILYRRSRKEMPASHEEIEAAIREGVDIRFLVAPVELSNHSSNAVNLQFIRMELGEPDASGRRRPVPVEGSEMSLEVDMVISAIGQYPQVPTVAMDGALTSLPLTRWSTIGGDPRSMHTGMELVFVGGDVFRGPATVVAALADGRKAAFSMDRLFQVGRIEPEPLHFNISKGDLETIDREPFSVLKTISRESMPELEVHERLSGFQEVEQGYHEEQARREAGRCLACGCSAAFDCRLRDFMNAFQIDWRDQPSKKIHYQRVASVDTHPGIALDPNKCIRCERCNVACETIQCSDAITLKEWPRFNDRCVHCGLCVDLCPTGALMEKRQERPVDRLDWRSVPTHCVHCGCGCRIDLQVSGERLVWIKDGQNAPPAGPSTCRHGRFHSFDSLWFGDRLINPLIRRRGATLEVSWHEALQAVADGFSAVSKHHGPGAVGAWGSPRAANEALYLLQRWMRTAWESNGLDFPGRRSREGLLDLLRFDLNGRLSPGSLGDLERAGAVLLLGDAVEETAPVAATLIRRARRSRRVPVFQLSSAPDALTPSTTLSLHVEPARRPECLTALATAVARSSGLPAERLRELGLETAAEGDPPPLPGPIRQEAWDELVTALLKAPSVALVLPETLTGWDDTRETARAALRFASLMNLQAGRPKAGLHILSPEINTAGALLMGVSPTLLPGHQPLSDAATRERMAGLWGAPHLNGTPGEDLEASLEAGRLKALFIHHAAHPQRPESTLRHLSSVDFLVVMDEQPSAVSDLAHVVLPAAGFAEQAGSVINMESRLLALEPALSPPGRALPEWRILLQLLRHQGLPCPEDLEALRREMAEAVPRLSGWAFGGIG